MSEPNPEQSLIPSKDAETKGRFHRIKDKFLSRRRQENVRKSTEEEIQHQLADAFAKKAFADIESNGYTTQSIREGDNNYVSETSAGGVIYRNGDKTYHAHLAATRNGYAGQRPYTTKEGLSLIVMDNIPARSPEAHRMGSFHKDVYPPDPDTPGEQPTEMSSVGFSLSKEGGNLSFPTSDINTFLEELLAADVDPAATQTLYEEACTSLENDPHKRSSNSIFWNRDNPGKFTEFFSSITPPGQHPHTPTE